MWGGGGGVTICMNDSGHGQNGPHTIIVRGKKAPLSESDFNGI